MELIKANAIKTLSNPGVVSRQILNPDNSTSKRVTITEVHLEIGASQPRHTHDSSEQIWYAVQGTGKLLLPGIKSRNLQPVMWCGLRTVMCMACIMMAKQSLCTFRLQPRRFILVMHIRKKTKFLMDW